MLSESHLDKLEVEVEPTASCALGCFERKCCKPHPLSIGKMSNWLAETLESLFTVDEGRGGLKFFAEDSDIGSEASFDLAMVLKAK